MENKEGVNPTKIGMNLKVRRSLKKTTKQNKKKTTKSEIDSRGEISDIILRCFSISHIWSIRKVNCDRFL